MVDLTSLKEQLLLLGHDLPDDQIVAILGELNIDYQPEIDQSSERLTYKSETREVFSRNNEEPTSHQDDDDWESEEKETYSRYRTQQDSEVSSDGEDSYSRSEVGCKNTSSLVYKSLSPSSDDLDSSSIWEEKRGSFDQDSIRLPKKSILKKNDEKEEFNRTESRGRERRYTDSQPYNDHLDDTIPEDDEEGVEDDTLFYNKSTSKPCLAEQPSTSPASSRRRPSSAAPVSQNRSNNMNSSNLNNAFSRQCPSSAVQRPQSARPASKVAAKDTAGANAAISFDDYGKFRNCKTAPSVTSNISACYSSTTISSHAGGAPKVDRVSRYQQMQQSWSKDRFLSAAGERKASSRKLINYHQHFKALHSSEDQKRKQMLKETRSKTDAALAEGREYVTPNAKARDELRW
eukprot:CAMPEP_0175047050 /NCGR_PEP_ID=MMETSP0052_2-20121109/5374_1 /TAXON_ID=51329 ORGANISM="Polytomella parva, Strain SAG 63-3" /NCGR_SAMPLE_ID=MMETSP0052_2 /ASSEMBLY_ACC=CAM_ASM_000194 /LENGTH=403 /DNA_ID=CAMNT_0016310871 /DNA_START=12 /DNA_END=1220 /DNA_ORIENTATION=+